METSTAKFENRDQVIAELDIIEAALKSINVEADNNGNFERSASHAHLIQREDELMEELQNFPL